MEFAGLTAIITGGASGLGEATAAMLTDRGAKVAVLDLAPEKAAAGVLALQCDVSDDEAVRAAVDEAALALGGIDIVINSAGLESQGTVETNSDAEWHRVLDINVIGIVRICRAALPYLRQSENAAIVNICSIVGTAGLPERVLYSTSKGAVRSLTLSMAADLVREGIRVNCVNPGTADTPWIQRALSIATDPEWERQQLMARQPHGRFVTADEVAAAIAYLASPLAKSTTGTDLAVDGGMQGLRLRVV